MNSENVTEIIDLEAPESWPLELREYLDRHYVLFLDWEQPSKLADDITEVRAYDQAIVGLGHVLAQFALVGWHCTRLTDDELTPYGQPGCNCQMQRC